MNIKSIIRNAALLATLPLAGSLMGSCADYKDYNTVPGDANAHATKTLYQNILENAQLKNLAQIVNKAEYADVLNSSQYFTLWAPLDGTYDAQKILAMPKDTIVSRFLRMHMAQYSYPLSGVVDQRIISLNEKHHTFSNVGGDYFDALAVKEANIPATNGLMHTIDGMSEYYPNIFEYVDQVQGCKSFVEHIRKYNIEEIDKAKSVEGPMVDGKQTYLDVVMRKRNDVVDRIMNAAIANEDQIYTVLFLNDSAWDEAYKRISPRYNYISPVEYMNIEGNSTAAANVTATTAKAEKAVQIDAELYHDSLPKAVMMRDLAFDNLIQENRPIFTGQMGTLGKADSLQSCLMTGYEGGKPYYNHLSNVEEILSHCGPVQSMSNGFVRVLDKLCYKPEETYEKPSMGSVVRYLGLKTGAKPTQYTVGKDTLLSKHRDMLSGLDGYDFLKSWLLPKSERFMSYISTDSVNVVNASAKPELDFALRNVLSSKYYIYVVLVPSQLKESWRPVSTDKEENKNLYLRFDMSYTDADGKQQYTRLNKPGAKKTDDILVVNDGKFHVVPLEFEFPICYHGLEAFPTLFMSLTKSFTSSANRRKFEQELRVAGVFLVPEDIKPYADSIKFEE